ncbi:hypothetical protein [Streptomyces sp. NPDC051776]|uniref:hypothetical protein n=1 Tax=Streptomyces sp. NPDC051776 TaxID=3155414 RepID=UPI003417990F
MSLTLRPKGTLSATGDGHTLAYQGGPAAWSTNSKKPGTSGPPRAPPDLYDYGMTVEPEQQYMWARDPKTGPRWPVTGQRSGLTPATARRPGGDHG